MGIDPGYDRLGYAALEVRGSSFALLASGVLQSTRGLGLGPRLHEIALGLDQLLALWKPASLAAEELFFSANAKTAMGVAHARGVVLQRAVAAGIEVAEYAPTTVKSQLCGSGRADKAQVEFMVRRLVGSPELGGKRLDDEMDAIAVALCHAMRQSIPAALRRASGTGTA
jgi:crossover junction endodeoxyribonuclease RuvC